MGQHMPIVPPLLPEVQTPAVPCESTAFAPFDHHVFGPEFQDLHRGIGIFHRLSVPDDVPGANRRAGMVVGDPVADQTGSLSRLGLDGNFEKLLGHVGIGDAPGDDDRAVLPGILHFRQGHGGFGQEAPGFGGIQDDQSGHFLLVRAGLGNSDFVEHKNLQK